MSEEKKVPTGIKTTLEKIDSEILQINKELSENSLVILHLKNESAKLKDMFDNRYAEIERNIKIDVEKFEEEIERNYKNHNNSRKLLEKKVKDIENSQIQLAENLYDIEQKVKVLEESLG